MQAPGCLNVVDTLRPARRASLFQYVGRRLEARPQRPKRAKPEWLSFVEDGKRAVSSAPP